MIILVIVDVIIGCLLAVFAGHFLVFVSHFFTFFVGHLAVYISHLLAIFVSRPSCFFKAVLPVFFSFVLLSSLLNSFFFWLLVSNHSLLFNYLIECELLKVQAGNVSSVFKNTYQVEYVYMVGNFFVTPTVSSIVKKILYKN